MDPLLVVLVDRVWEDVCLLLDIYGVYNQFDESSRPPIKSFFVALAELLQHDNSYLEESKPSQAGVIPASLKHFDDDYEGRSKDAKSLEEKEDDGGADLVDFCRVVLTSVLGDLLVFPFWSVKVAAVTGRARVASGIYPFESYVTAFSAVRRQEGLGAIWKGATPMCMVGLMHNFHRIRRALHLDPDQTSQSPPPSNLPAASSKPARTLKKSKKCRTLPVVMTESADTVKTDKKKKKQKNKQKERLIYTMSERGSLQQRVIWSLILHPLELISVRMITESRKEYRTWKTSLRYVCSGPSGWRGLFFGTRSTLLNAIVPYGGWCLLGIPFLIKCRRMLHGQDQDMVQVVRESLQNGGASGLFCGMRAAVTGLVPSLAALVSARCLVQATLGTARRRTRNRAKRTAFYLSLLMKIIPAKDRERMLKTRYSNNL